MARTAWRLAGVALIVWGSALNLRAECVRIPLQTSKQKADVVFSGVVTRVSSFTGGRHIADFDVELVWKGRVQRQTRVYYYVDMIEAVRFEPGKRYVVFAPKWGLLDFLDARREAEEDGLSSCGWGVEFESVKSEVPTLGKARRP